MKVTGPDWPSTTALREALSTLETDKVLDWGHRLANGLQQLETFDTVGVRCPEFTTVLADAQEAVRDGQLVFGRRLLHTQGSDIIGPGYRPAMQKIPFGHRVPERWNLGWTNRDFWVKAIPIEEEFRQHVWDGRCIRIGRKILTGDATRVQPIRSRSNGWTIDYSFQIPDDLKDTVRQAAKNAVAALGYPGGAVDIILGTDGLIYVLEVNAGPSLRDENTLKAYVSAIYKQVNRKVKTK